MKNYLYFLSLLCAIGFCTGCSDDDDVPINQDIVGEWHLQTWNTEKPSDFDVYIAFGSDGRFELYQQVETSGYVRYDGAYATHTSTLTGQYSDMIPWSCAYTYVVSDGGDTLMLTSQTDNAEVGLYLRTPIPADLRNMRNVRSETATPPFRIL